MDTFVVRVWVPRRGTDRTKGQNALLQGIAEHVASGARVTFRTADELIGFLERVRLPDRVPDVPAFGVPDGP